MSEETSKAPEPKLPTDEDVASKREQVKKAPAPKRKQLKVDLGDVTPEVAEEKVKEIASKFKSSQSLWTEVDLNTSILPLPDGLVIKTESGLLHLPKHTYRDGKFVRIA